jgi:hypothetical protein
MSVSDTEDQNLAAIVQAIDDEVRADRVDTDRRHDFGALAGGKGVIAEELEGGLQLGVVALCLVQAEPLDAGKEDFNNVVLGFAA